MRGSSIYWFNKVRGITLLLLLMNCQQFNLVKSYRGIYIYILEEWEILNSYVNVIPSLPRTVAKAMSLLSQTALGLQTFPKVLATNRQRWQWKDCSSVLQVLLQNVIHSIIDADRKEGRKFTFSKAILLQVQPKEKGFKGYIKVRRYYVIQNQNKGLWGEGLSTWICWNKYLRTIRKLSALLCYPACGLISPTWTPGKHDVLQLFPDFEEMDNLRSTLLLGSVKLC